MGLDVRISSQKPIICPHCGKIAGYKTVRAVESDDSKWFGFLEEIGYTAIQPNGKSWYGKNMVLTDEQADSLVHYAVTHNICVWSSLGDFVYDEKEKGNKIVINADW